MFLYIARHAWAGERGDPRWPDDSLRELTPDGIERYTQVVKSLADRGFCPDRIATSPYIRCRQTAEIVAKYASKNATIDELDALEPGTELEPVIQWSRKQTQTEANICWVGHSPDVEWLTAVMIGDTNARIRFAKGAIAAISFDAAVDAGTGELSWLATAKSLGV